MRRYDVKGYDVFCHTLLRLHFTICAASVAREFPADAKKAVRCPVNPGTSPVGWRPRSDGVAGSGELHFDTAHDPR
jgi:hypothetical protein